MSDVIQNVRIKFLTDTSALADANKALNNLTTSEQATAKAFEALNSSAVKAANNVKTGAQVANTEATKSVGIINNLRQNIDQLTASRDKSSDPTKIKIYNDLLTAQNAKLKDLTGGTDKLNKSSTGLNSTFKTVGASIVAAFSVQALLSFGKQVLGITSEFEKLRAVLTNTLGSQSLADSALNKIKNLAATTNFGVLELTNAYVKLANSGFEPTTKELTALADLTNSTGKTFDQLAEAILDANTDQFIRLKEFGIKATREGDKISFLFKGVRTEVDRNSSSITKYLISLGQIPGVMGSTAAISGTLAGKTSNLGDAYDFLLNTIGSQQSGFFKTAIQGLTDFTTFLSKALQTTAQFNEELTSNAAGHYQNQIVGFFEAEKKALGDDTKAIVAFNSEQVRGLEIAKESNQQDVESIKNKIALNNAELKTINAKTKADNESLRIDTSLSESRRRITTENDELNKKLILVNGTIRAQEQVVHDLENENKQIGIAEQERARLAEESAAKKAKAREKRFKDELDEVNQAEQNAVRRAKLEGQTANSIIGIEQVFNDKREQIYKNYNKNRGADFESLILKSEELEQELTVSQKAEIDRREKLDKDYADSRLANIDDALTKQNTKTTANTNEQIKQARQAYVDADKKTIAQRYELEKNLSDIAYTSQRDQINNAIIADQEKLKVANITSEQRTAIESDLVNKKKELDDLDFQNFQDTEKKKSAELEKQDTIRLKIAHQAFQTGVSITNSLFQIGQNNRDAEAQDLQLKQNEELKSVGNNQKEQDVINQKYAKKQLDLRIKNAKAQKTQSEFDAVLNGAVAVTSALKIEPEGVVLAALIAAEVAAQVVAIQSKPLPKFYHGTDSLQLNGNPDGIDTIPIMAHKNERIVPSYINDKLLGIPNAKLPELAEIWRNKLDYKGITNDVINGRSGGQQDNALLSEIKNMNKKLDGLKVANITIDKNGIRSYVETKNSQTEFVNNYFRN